MEISTTFRTHNSKTWLSFLLSYFMNIKYIDDNIEYLRISLCSQPNFSPLKLFQVIDKNSKKFLLLNDFIKFLKEMQIPFEEKYLRIFIHNFDKDGDFCINLKEFLGIILPKKNLDLAKKVTYDLNSDNYSEDIISMNLKNIFGKILCEELELVKNCITNAKSCKEKVGFTLYEAFLMIAGNDRYICEQHLFKFLNKNNISIDNKDIHQLMFRLDADNDGKISFEEFKEIFFPIKEEEILYKIRDQNNSNINSFENKKEIKINIEDDVVLNKFDNIIDFTFARKSGFNHKCNKELSRNDNKIDFNILTKKKIDLKSYNTNKENYSNNENIEKESIYSRTRNLFQLKNQPQTPKIAPRIIIPKQYQESYPKPFDNNTSSHKKYKFNYSNNIIKNNPLLKKENIPKKIVSAIESPYHPKKIRKINTAYISPKTRHTKSPLHFDYSTYSDEDGDEYFKNRKLRQNKTSLTDKRGRIMDEKKINKILSGKNYKDEIRNDLEKMFSDENIKDKTDDINKKNEFDINKEIKKRQINSKFNFIYNGSNENDIVMRNFDDIKIKKYKTDKIY